MAAHGSLDGQQPSDAGPARWRDTTALPASATASSSTPCPPLTRDGPPGIDPTEAAIERALEERHLNFGVDPDR